MACVAPLLLVALMAPPARGDDLLRFCEDASHCREREACVGGLCVPLSDPRIRRLFPIAVDRLLDLDTGRRSGETVERLDGLLRRQLDLAGFFDVVDAGRNPEHALLESLRITTIDFQRWYDAGAWAVVKGTIRDDPKSGTGRVLTLHLFLVEEGRTMPMEHDTQALRSGSPRELRWAVARWVDDLLVAFTGKGGTFSTRIAFSKRLKKGGAKEIGVMDMDGSTETPVTENGEINMLPAWAPGGEIAYTSFVDHNPDLFVGKRKLSRFPRMNTGAAYHPSGRELAITLSKDGDAEIYVLDARSGRIRRRLTRDPAIDTSPSWSPDGRRLAFVSDRGGGGPGIYVMDADGANVRRPPQVGGYNSSPDWSPAGGRIAYSTMSGGERYDIYSIDIETGLVQRLTSQGSNEEPSFSPDGRYIAYTSTRDGSQSIWIMTADGANHRRVSRNDGIYMTPAWERRWPAKRSAR